MFQLEVSLCVHPEFSVAVVASGIIVEGLVVIMMFTIAAAYRIKPAAATTMDRVSTNSISEAGRKDTG